MMTKNGRRTTLAIRTEKGTEVEWEEEKRVHVPEKILSGMKNGMFDRIDTREKMNSTLNCMRKLKMDRRVLANIANCFLSINKKSKDFVDLATAVIDEDGLKIRDISRSLLVRLANDNKFKYQTEARKFMNLEI